MILSLSELFVTSILRNNVRITGVIIDFPLKFILNVNELRLTAASSTLPAPHNPPKSP